MSIFFLLFGLVIGVLVGWYLHAARADGGVLALRTELQITQQQLEEAKVVLGLAQERGSQQGRELARLEVVNQTLSSKLEERKQTLEDTEEKLTAQFKNLANDLLEEKSKKFTDQNRLHLENILNPLGERIQAFERQIAESNKDHLARSVALRTEVRKLNELNTQITKEAENLTKAIKGDQKVQGKWGEFILENVLEKSGLVKGREYSVQDSFTTETNKRYQPDVIISLPEGKHVVVDAKVSLVDYEQFFNTDQEVAQALVLKKHIQSVRKHIKELSEKNYHNLYGLRSLDFVLMFIPLEPAFSLALQNDLALFNEAYEKNIVLVSPTTLMATLRTIANLWKHEYQNQNALEIAQQGGALYDKFVDFVEDLKQLGRQVDITQKAYVGAMKKLYEGRGNLVKRAHNIRELGARTNKALDTRLVEQASGC